MKEHPGELQRQIEALERRLSALSAAVLRVSSSLDPDTVLQEVVDSARQLTGAGCAIVTTLDEAGAHQDTVFSGYTPDERRQMAAWPDKDRLFEHLLGLPGPLRVADLSDYVRSLGLEPARVLERPFQGTPMRHRDVHVGNFFLGSKAGGQEFTDDDEEVLALFASQAAAAVANARTHRSERQARARLEALVETSPVGVVVFDAGSARPLMVNRAARRIAEGLRVPGRSPEQLLEVISCRRADGREIPLGEYPTAHRLDSGETVRAEEIELAVPDGRSVRTLVNATPIRGQDGEVVSVVVTLQDLAHLDEIERMRAEFLGIVSRELRAPLASILGSTGMLLERSAQLDPAERRDFHNMIDEQARHMRDLIGDLLDAGRIRAGTLSVAPEPTEVAALVEEARSTFLSGGRGHGVLVDLPPDLPRVMADRRRIVQVLNNLLASAARNSLEAPLVQVSAALEGTHVAISVSDRGQGVPAERLSKLFSSYAGTDGEKRATEGTGLGLVICKGLVEAHGGRIRAESGEPGEGARLTFTVPVAEDAGQVAFHAVPAQHAPARVLVVDDDPQTLRYVREALTAAGYAALVTGDPAELSRIIRSERPDLVLLDLVLPGTDGIALLRSVPELADLPVVFISGYGRDDTIAEALEAGAADYLVKPFSPTELTTRVKAALHRAARPEPFALGELAIHYEQHRVTLAGRQVELTAKEYELLRVLSLNAGRVVTYDALLRRVWSGSKAGQVTLLRNLVKKLRAKLGDDAQSPTWIFSLRGVGYRMASPHEA